jgi:hypothetical protein
MKKIYSLILFGFFALQAHASEIFTELPHSELIDEILVTIYTKEGTHLILKSDLRPRLDGSPRTLRDIVLEFLLVLKAEAIKMLITDDEIERYLAQIQKDNKMTRKALERLFAELGYTYEEAVEQLRRTQMVGGLIEHKIKSRLIIQESEIIAYYDAHPEYREATYTLVQTFVSNNKTTLQELRELEKVNKLENAFEWEPEFIVQEDEMAADRRFIIDAPIGSLIEIQETDEGFELTLLKSKTPRVLLTLEERHQDIDYLLHRERYDTLLHEYENEVLNEALLRFTYDEDRQKIFNKK